MTASTHHVLTHIVRTLEQSGRFSTIDGHLFAKVDNIEIAGSAPEGLMVNFRHGEEVVTSIWFSSVLGGDTLEIKFNSPNAAQYALIPVSLMKGNF